MSMIEISMTVNGIEERHRVEANTLLVDFLRERCALTGVHVGCDTTQCGCCTVLVGGEALKACTLLAAQVEGCEIVTIEGIGAPQALHPLQAAFQRHHALQCGFCTPGMVMQGIDIVNRGRGADPEAVKADLKGNLCRCTGYQNIVEAIVEYAQQCAQTSQHSSERQGERQGQRQGERQGERQADWPKQ